MRKTVSDIREKLDSIFRKGCGEKWLNIPNKSLNNKTPLELIEKDYAGIKKVYNLLGQIEEGIVT